MATEEQKAGNEEVNADLFEDDDEFEEYEINQGVCVWFCVLICLEFYLYMWCESAALFQFCICYDLIIANTSINQMLVVSQCKN